MLSFDKEYKPRKVFDDYSKDLLNQISTNKISIKPIPPLNIKPFHIHKVDYDYSFKPHKYKLEHTGDDLVNLHPKTIEPVKETHLEEDVLKPLFGIENIPLTETGNPNHYQFRLQGKTDKDVMLSNMDQNITPLDVLKENAISGESIKSSASNLKDEMIKKMQESTPKISKAEFLAQMKSGKTGSAKPKSKGIKLTPVIEKQQEVIPITEADDELKKDDDDDDDDIIDEVVKETTSKSSKKVDKEYKAYLNNLALSDPSEIVSSLKTDKEAVSILLEPSIRSVLKYLGEPFNPIDTRQILMKRLNIALKTVKAKVDKIEKDLTKPDALKAPNK